MSPYRLNLLLRAQVGLLREKCDDLIIKIKEKCHLDPRDRSRVRLTYNRYIAFI